MSINLSEKQINAIQAMERKLGYSEGYGGIRDFKTKEEFSEYFLLLQKKIKKKDRFLTAKKRGTLKEKIWTIDKVVFYISKLIEKYGQRYTKESLLKKFKIKKIPEEIGNTACDEAIKKGILDENYYIESFISRKLRSGKGKSYIIRELKKKGISNTINIEEYFGEFENEAEEEGLQKQFQLLCKKFKVEGNEIENTIKQKIMKSLFSKGFSFSSIKELFDGYKINF